MRAKIDQLMEVFDFSSLREVDLTECAPRWKPCNDKEKRAFEALIDQESRLDLKKWYANIDSLNPLADAFRRILEEAIGEELPVAHK